MSQGELLPNADSAGTLVVRFPASRTVRNNLCCLIRHPACDTLSQQPKQLNIPIMETPQSQTNPCSHVSLDELGGAHGRVRKMWAGTLAPPGTGLYNPGKLCNFPFAHSTTLSSAYALGAGVTGTNEIAQALLFMSYLGGVPSGPQFPYPYNALHVEIYSLCLEQLLSARTRLNDVTVSHRIPATSL